MVGSFVVSGKRVGKDSDTFDDFKSAHPLLYVREEPPPSLTDVGPVVSVSRQSDLE